MVTFQDVIGYDAIKNEMLQICDVLKNRDVYRRLGASMPKGLLLYGEPGLGKTLLASALITESGLPSVIIRKTVAAEDFINEIAEKFQYAKEHAPSILFLDDMDKFANEDSSHCDAEEYVAVQAGIDDVKGSDVFVIATVNDEDKLPKSLLRTGRFDRKIELEAPSGKDAALIIQHYLSGKNLADDFNMDDVVKMITYNSCAELETITNEAALHAAFARKETIGTEDFVYAVLRMQYNAVEGDQDLTKEDQRRVALHEAGHLVICELLCPGSVGFASLRSSTGASVGGFIHRCKPLARRSHDTLVTLGGKAAVELFYADTAAGGCREDLERALGNVFTAVSESGTCGLALLDMDGVMRFRPSNDYVAHVETAVHAELERYMFQARDMLIRNRDFLTAATEALLEKKMLLYSDVQAIRKSVGITDMAG